MRLIKNEDLSVFVDLDKEDENNENSDPRLAALGLRKILNSSYKIIQMI